jgi:hypothetical protein
MRRSLGLLVLLGALAGFHQASAAPKKTSSAVSADPCAPVGKTDDGKIIYPVTCDRFPTRAEQPVRQFGPATEQTDSFVRTGLFGLSFEPADRNVEKRIPDGYSPR